MSPTVRNHAKYLVVNLRFVMVTSANFSHSAESENIGFGVRIDAPNLAEAIEGELQRRRADPVRAGRADRLRKGDRLEAHLDGQALGVQRALPLAADRVAPCG